MDLIIVPFVLISVILLKDTNCNVIDYGEPCNHTAECSDHRLVCVPDRWNVSKCECDRFHYWGGTALGCLAKYDVPTILNMSVVSTDNQARLEKDRETIYFGHKLAGYFVMLCACICPIVVAIHCCHVRRKDSILKRDLTQVQERVDAEKVRRAKLARINEV